MWMNRPLPCAASTPQTPPASTAARSSCRIAKAQAITQTENHASTIFVLLKDTAATDAVVQALTGSSLEVKTWRDLNPLVVEFETMAQSYISLFYLIILAITASVIINTLIMSVYERTREIGILSAIGMKGGRIMGLFLAESALLAVGGVIMGLVIGTAGRLSISTSDRFLHWQHGTDRILVADTICTPS